MRKKIFTFLAVIFLSLLFTPYSRNLYVNEFGLDRDWFFGFGPSDPEYFYGFLYNLLIFGSFFAWTVFRERKYLLYYVAFPLGLNLMTGFSKQLFIAVVLIIIGLTSGELINRLIKAFRNDSGRKDNAIKSNLEIKPIVKEKPQIKYRKLFLAYLFLELFYFLPTRLPPETDLLVLSVALIQITFMLFALFYCFKKRRYFYYFLLLYLLLDTIRYMYINPEGSFFIGNIINTALVMLCIFVILSFYFPKKITFADKLILPVIIVALVSIVPLLLIALLMFMNFFGDFFGTLFSSLNLNVDLIIS